MNTIIYTAHVTGDRMQGYTAIFPDVPGATSTGDDFAALLVSARQVLAAELEARDARGDAWPPATPFDDIVVPPGARAIPVEVAVEDPPIRVNVSLGEKLVERLDAAADSLGMTRSGYIAQAVRRSLGDSARASRTSYDETARRIQDEVLAMGRKLNDSLGPDSAFSRRMSAIDDLFYDGVRRAADSVSAAVSRRASERAAAPSAEPSSPPPA